MVAASGDRIAQGAAWMIAARLADRAIGLVGTVILARLLTPADFGLVAMALAVIGLIELASAFGFELTLVRKARPTPEQYHTVWTLNVLFGFSSGLVTAAAAYPASVFYGEPRLVPVMLVLGVAWALGSLENVGIVDFRRTLNFSREFKFLMTRRLVGSVVMISLAFLTRSYWALIAGTIALRATGVVLSYLWHDFRPRISLAARGEVFSYSVWVLVDKVGSFGFMRFSDFLLGRTHGAAEVGLYRLGEEIGHLPGTELIAPINRALLPGVAQMADSGRPTSDLVLSSTGVVALILIPACLGISVVADQLVRVMLGAQWISAVPVVQLMAMDSMFMALWANQHTTLFAIGKPNIPALVSIGRLCVFLVMLSLLIGAHGALGVAMSALVASACTLAVGLWISLPILGVGFRKYCHVLWRPLLAGGGMSVAVTWLIDRLEATGAISIPLLRLMLSVAAGCLMYPLMLGVLFVISGRPEGTERLLARRLLFWVRRRAN